MIGNVISQGSRSTKYSSKDAHTACVVVKIGTGLVRPAFVVGALVIEKNSPCLTARIREVLDYFTSGTIDRIANLVVATASKTIQVNLETGDPLLFVE